MESMGVVVRCNLERDIEIEIDFLITYPYSSCICSFLQQHPYFSLIFKTLIICNKPEHLFFHGNLNEKKELLRWDSNPRHTPYDTN